MRSEYEIIRDLLMAADGGHMTDIYKKVGINQTRFKVLMPPMVKKGFVTKAMDVRPTYTITDKGKELVARFDALAKELIP